MDSEGTANQSTDEDKQDKDASDVSDNMLNGEVHPSQEIVAREIEMNEENGIDNDKNARAPGGSDQTTVPSNQAEQETEQVAEEGEETLSEPGSSPAAGVSQQEPGLLTSPETSVAGAQGGGEGEELSSAQTIQSDKDEHTDHAILDVDQHVGYGEEAANDDEDRSEELDLPVVPAGREEDGRNGDDQKIVCNQNGVTDREHGKAPSENKVMHPDSSNSSVDSKECADREDGSENAASVGFDSHEASLIAQDLVHDVLDRVLQAEGEREQKSADNGTEEDRDAAQFPELKKVDLNSEDWDHDFHARASAVQDVVSLSSSEDDSDRQPLKCDMLGGSEENADGTADVIKTNIVSDREKDPLVSDEDAHVGGSEEDSHAAQHPPTSLDKERKQTPADASLHFSLTSGGKVESPLDSSATPSPPALQTRLLTDSEQVSEQPAQLEESKDGSYLWLQQQTQWRASSKELPKSKTSRETAKQDSASNSPRSKLEKDNLGGVMSDNKIEISDEKTTMSTSASRLAEASTLSSSPGAIPNFKTLQDQQVSWLSMYRMLEEQHRGELQAQYTEHQRMIDEMQRHLEGELVSQQFSVQQKLHLHREALREQTSRAQGRDDSWNTLLADTDREAYIPNRSSSSVRKSATTMQERSSWRSSHDNQRSRTEIGDKKQLCGGVYSSPMPLSKSKKYAEATGSMVDARHFDEESAKRSKWSEDSQYMSYADHGVQEEQIVSPRTRLGLKEKHAKHMADLRTYYEAEIQDLRHKLNSMAGVQRTFSGSLETANDRILQQENQTLRLQLRNLQDSLDDAHIHNRELEQKLQGLEIRAADYCERYQESQHIVLKLKNRLEELHSYAQDRESMLEKVQAAERKQAATLQEMQKAHEELTETSLKDRSAWKMLLDKHKMLEEDYNALRESATDFEKKLFETRKETVELNKTISQLELENKRLGHENSNLCHRVAISGSFPVSRSEVPDLAMQRGLSDDYTVGRMSNGGTGTARSPETQDRTVNRRVTHDEEDFETDDKFDSPLLKAEHELRRLQQTMARGEFVPMLQPKKYRSSNSLGPATDDVVIIDALTSPTRSASSRPDGRKKEKKILNSATSGGPGRTAYNISPDHFQASSLSSPTRFDVGIQQASSRSSSSSIRREGGAGREQASEKERSPARKSTAKGDSEAKRSVDSTLERIRGGKIVSRPQWEDVYTSLAKPQQLDNKMSSLNMTQEEMLRDRVHSITQVEKRYDMLQVEKKNLESKLNKIPSHGRDRKTRREKELLEDKLDNVDHELGSLRMTLKRYQVLKTTI